MSSSAQISRRGGVGVRVIARWRSEGPAESAWREWVSAATMMFPFGRSRHDAFYDCDKVSIVLVCVDGVFVDGVCVGVC